ncbi:MAG: hypothetical protein LKG48_05625 [Lachnospiraceae bacterium]|jgi:hypothetical protein|nr:hypothetical protein [Lachnospiraceae bacterium]MCH4063340.1 hypothetical protein [Lachnospiraceae bacterium]MCH4104491.1 hypothetical protein [Lachnospiraceae bacterium]MCI1309228.1 hypothetical protein [Lachnospiraceae bacterium]MCI1333569.1 hypothetical protein [Lachnospiraceae bacterium]
MEKQNYQEKGPYRQYRRELQSLRDGGCRLYYPGDREITPKQMAETMATDQGATYMRDTVYDQKGRPVGIHFQRINLE